MLINTFLDTEDFVHLYYPEDEPSTAQGCGAGARMHGKYPPRPPTPDYDKITSSSSEMTEREHARAPPEPPPQTPHRVRAAELYPRLRTTYDEPGLDVPFNPICGEFVQWVGKTADGGTIAMSNYRVHVQPRKRSDFGLSIPLRLIEVVEVRDIVHLVALCKDGRTVKCTFTTCDQCNEWWRRLNTAIAPIVPLAQTFAAQYAAWAKEQPPASVHRALMKASHAPQRHWFGPELNRLGFTEKGAWRVTTVNSDYKICSSYPPLLVVPASIGDGDLDAVADFRSMRRVPAVVWRHRGNGAVIARSSQPEVGWLGWRSSEDERLLAAFVTACDIDRGLRPDNNHKQTKLLIVDARSYTSAVTNRARGGGVECQQYYPAADIQFMCLPNIHNVRKSFLALRAIIAEPGDANFFANVDKSSWLQHVASLGRAANLVARAVLTARPVLVHCSDGWDRTPQIVATAQLLLDPYYRTCEGFRTLIEREWLDFGHKFADRCGHSFKTDDTNERSPIFIQWLDLVHQIMTQYPTSFEFSQAYLLKLVTHVYSCMFGTFLCNTPRERAEHRVHELTARLWHLLSAPNYRNHLYCAPSTADQVLWPDYSVRCMRVWELYVCRAEHEEPPPPALATVQPPHNGPMTTRTRSCDDLLADVETSRRTTQRRCSDPNIAPDVMKLSCMMQPSSSPKCSPPESLETQLDTMSALERSDEDNTDDQVDGLNPHHFENGSVSPPRAIATDITSTSSSLERELTAVPPPTYLDSYTDVRELSRDTNRQRNVSITWRSVSESSHQTDSSAGDIETHRINNNHESTEVVHTNHSLPEDMTATLTNHNRIEGNGDLSNGDHLDDVSAHLLQTELGPVQSELPAPPSSLSSESEGECGSRRVRRPRGPARRGGSQLTLTGSPRAHPCLCCGRTCRRASATSGIETSGDSLPSLPPPRTPAACAPPPPPPPPCWCGAGGSGAGGAAGREPPDGLPVPREPLQARLHQIIVQQRLEVQELREQLEAARAALQQRASASPPPPAASALVLANHQTSSGSNSTSSVSVSRSGSGSGSGSGSEVEVGEEARGVVWLPDSAAPRCQHCHHHFWLARRRHHCRKCGGIFCSSCSELGTEAIRVCRRCR